ncbi:MAG: MBL fold metallo-hydrolase [Planctomycetes bacterium]|nr:MBL fold metallo-hydrolase [Planctomycetota bacterium]
MQMRTSIHIAALLLFIATTVRAADEPKRAVDRIVTEVGNLTIRPIQHATFVIDVGGVSIYVDPVGGAGAFQGIPAPNLILITDIHGDHLNAKTVASVSTDKTKIVAPAAVHQKLADTEKEKTIVLANGQKTEFSGITIEAIPMYNLTEERKKFHTKGRGNGYVLTIGGKRLYICGDTEDIPEMRKLKGIDVAFVCMNLPYTMDVEHAASAVLEFKPKIVYPFHYRGAGGKLSDIEKFKKLVSKNKEIEVRFLNWYP